MRLDITVLLGDGVGPEVTREAVRVLRTVLDLYGYEASFEERAVGGVAIRQFGTPLPEATARACTESHAVLLGAVGGPEFDSLPAAERPEAGLLALRQVPGRLCQSASRGRVRRHRRLLAVASGGDQGRRRLDRPRTAGWNLFRRTARIHRWLCPSRL